MSASKIPGIHKVACIYNAKRKRIVLFYAGGQNEKVLIALLKKKLPQYTMPNRTIQLENLPLTPN